MKQFLRKILIFLIPFPLYLGIVILIDPYNYYGISNFISRETKIETSAKYQRQIWKMIEYKKMKSNKIILGDSRSDLIHTNDIKNLKGGEVFNFSYGGGTLIEIIETFWYALEIQKLEEVYIGINFNLYNDFERNNQVKQARGIMKNPLTYTFNKVVFIGMIQNIKKQFFVKDFTLGVPDMDRDEFWRYQISEMGKRFYQQYKYPEEYHEELVKISNYCKENNIHLIFFMPPTHVDLQKRILDFNLEKENKKFIDDITKLGELYNFDDVNEYTSNKNNFLDPFHPVNDSLIVHMIWNK